jgi:hypothetical protein
MVKKFFNWVLSPMGLIAVLLVGLAVFSIGAYGVYRTQQPAKPQDIEFPHDLHVGFGIQCLYCHPGALRGPSPGLPTITKCWGCHQQIAKTATSEKLAPMREAMANGTGFTWVPVAKVPEFVHFNHRPHIAAGVNCEDCHGDMSKVEIAENPQVMNMGWCLDCHKQKAEEAADEAMFIKLTDCGTCHY